MNATFCKKRVLADMIRILSKGSFLDILVYLGKFMGIFKNEQSSLLDGVGNPEQAV